MAIPYSPNLVKLVQRWEVANQRHVFTTTHYLVKPGAADFPATANEWQSKCATRLLAVMSSGVTLGQVELTDYSGPGHAGLLFSTAHTGAVGSGPAPGDIPQGVAFVVTWRTGLSGRRHRGRTYFPGVWPAAIATPGTNQLDSTVRTTFIGQAQGLVDDLSGDSYALQVLSKVGLGSISTIITADMGHTLGEQSRRWERRAHR